MSDYDAMEITVLNSPREQLEKMSDHEVNLAVAKKLGLDTEVGNMRYKGGAMIGEFVFAYLTPTLQVRFEPCTNWNDVMPIAIDNKIEMLVYYNDVWIARKAKIYSLNQNPRRAICEVFLMMGI
jgi:hypothetical protein